MAVQTKDPVRLRAKKLSSGMQSLYLDLYYKGKREFEFLRLYLVPEHSRADREKNRETLRLAEDVRAKRLVEFRNGEYGFKSRDKVEALFYPYYRKMCEERTAKREHREWDNWYMCLNQLLDYDGNEQLRFRDITPRWVKGFKDYLDTKAKAHGHEARERENYAPLKQNTKVIYFNKLRACLHRAHEEGLIEENPMQGIDNFRGEECSRAYLTIEEVRQLAATECRYESLRRAFLFSCLTGLRRSDIEKLTWGEVSKQGSFTRITFTQRKTHGLEYLDITPQAADLMGERGEDDAKVFGDLLKKCASNINLQRWVTAAGIHKHITFHCARHTFAVMMLDLGTDLYTTSKLLGHRSIATTQIYAKVLDKNKQAAVERIPTIL